MPALSMRRATVTLLSALLLTACVSSPRSVTPLTQAGNGFASSDNERKLIAQAEDAHQDMVKRGLLVNDEAANAYINRVGARIQPTIAGDAHIRYFILKDATVNAMAFPNGNIYVNVGLIARLESEDQLALVLAHETAHVVQRHDYKGMLDRHNTVIAAHVTDLLLMGTGIGYLPYIMDLASFSREQEQEADLCGLEYLHDKGYDGANSVLVFDKLGEVKHGDRSNSVWSSHPGLKARKNYSLQKIGDFSPAQHIASGEYEPFRRKLADLSIQLRMLNGQYELAGDAIDFEIAQQGEAPQWHVYKGDALREAAARPLVAAQEYAWLYDETLNDALKEKFQREAAQKFDAALDQYQAALKLDANTPTALRGIGLVALARGDNAQARDYLQRYLAGAQNPSDRRYIQSQLDRLKP